MVDAMSTCPGCGEPVSVDMCTISAKTRDGERLYHVPCAEQKITVYGLNKDSCGSTFLYDRIEDVLEDISGTIECGMMVGDEENFNVTVRSMARVEYDCLPEGEC